MSNGPVLACSRVITTHNFDSKHPVSVYSPHRGLINCATFNHTNKVIASSGQDGRIVLVSAEEKDKVLAQFVFDGKKQGYGSSSQSSVNACLFSPHSKFIAAGASDHLVKVWAMSNHKEVYLTLRNHQESISALAWTKNQEILASSSLGGSIFLHSVKNGKPVEQIMLKPQDPINSIKISQGNDYSRLAACTEAGAIRIWDLDASRNCKLTSSFENPNKVSITSISFSTFNPVLLVASSLDQNLNFYDISEKKAVKTIATEQPLTAVNFHSDGHTLIAGGMYGGLFVYDLRKPQKPKERLTGHETAVKYIDFHKERQIHYQRDSQPNREPTKGSRDSKGLASTSQTNSVSKLPKKVEERSNEQNLQRKQEHKSSSKHFPPKQVPPSVYSRRQQLSTVPPTNTVQSVSSPPPLQNNFIEKPIAPVIQSPNTKQEVVANQPQAFQNLRLKLQDSIAERFEMLHLEIIRQFQIQQDELKFLIQQNNEQSKMKDRKIKELEEQIAKMKKNRY